MKSHEENRVKWLIDKPGGLFLTRRRQSLRRAGVPMEVKEQLISKYFICMKKNITLILLTILLFVIISTSCNVKKDNNTVEGKHTQQTDYVINEKLLLNDYSEYKGFISEDGFVPNEKIAFQIAEVILSQIYGKETIESEKPFSINLEKNVWIIEGSLPKEYDKGGVAYIEISKQTGQILKVLHTK